MARRKYRQRGGSLKSFFRKVGSFLKKTKLISRLGRTLGAVGVPYAGTIGTAAGSIGYGRRGRRRCRRRYKRKYTRHRRRGGALKLAGMGLTSAGGMRMGGMRRGGMRGSRHAGKSMTYF
jgi:hypothetical protein